VKLPNARFWNRSLWLLGTVVAMTNLLAMNLTLVALA